jgi:hypothetical protein
VGTDLIRPSNVNARELSEDVVEEHKEAARRKKRGKQGVQ